MSNKVWIFIITLLVLVCPAEAQRKIRIVNLESGLTRLQVESEVRRGIRTLRRELGRRYRIVSYKEMTDRSPEYLELSSRSKWFQGTLGVKKGYITLAIYRSRLYGYGRATMCSKEPFISIAYGQRLPPLWLKFVIAHEVGHTLGAGHIDTPQSVLATYDHDPLTLMHPAWDTWFWKKERSPELVTWKFSLKSKLEMLKCGKIKKLKLFSQDTDR